jgi:hypothetical protein
MRQTIQSIEHTCDFCVVGGGLAGVCAAIAAARGGSRVTLMQDRPVLGGNASSEIRMWICGAHGSNNRETGIIEEIQLENLRRNPDKIPYLFDTILYEKVKAEPNITLLLNCSCLDAEMDGNRIVSVTGWQLTTQQKHIVRARLYADCSGDSILAPLTGASFRFGREAAEEFSENVSTTVPDKKTMGISLLLGARRTDRTSEFVAPAFARKLTEEEVARRMPNLNDDYENFWYLELGGEQDCIGDAEDIRDDLLSLALGMWDYIKNSGKFEDAAYWQLDFLGFLPAKRESRRMMGAYLVNQRDVMGGGLFPDVVAFGGWALDDHFPGGFFHKGPPNVEPRTPSPYGIPYRALYSANIENLYFAGRNISMTHAAMSSTRVMATCALVGQAVGTAANLAREYALTPAQIYSEKIGELQERLMDADCFLPRLRRTVSEVAKAATLTASAPVESPDRLRNGADRTHFLYGEEDMGVMIPCGTTVTYTLAQPAEVQTVRITFDSDLDRVSLPGSRSEQEHNSRLVVRPDSPTMTMPKPLVRAYRLTATLSDGTSLTLADVTDNALRTVHIPVRIPAGKAVASLALTPLCTWGGTSAAHVFSFDFR